MTEEDRGQITEIAGPWRDINRAPLLMRDLDPKGLWVFLVWVLIPNTYTFAFSMSILLLLWQLERRGWNMQVLIRYASSWMNDHVFRIKVD